MTSVAAVMLTASGASASTAASARSADGAWAATIKNDSLEAYAEFAMMYPDSEHAQSAYNRLSAAYTDSISAGVVPQNSILSGEQQKEQSAPRILPGQIRII